MNTGNYNIAIGQLVFYRRMAVLAERGTPDYAAYVAKLDAGCTVLGIAYDKDFDAVCRDVCEAYASKYRY